MMSIWRRTYPTARAAIIREMDFILMAMVWEVIIRLDLEDWVADVDLNDARNAREAVR